MFPGWMRADLSPPVVPVPHIILDHDSPGVGPVRVRGRGIAIDRREKRLEWEFKSVRAPVSETEPVVQKIGQNFATQAAVRRVLVIDDDKDVADSLAMLLELLGCDVRTAYSGVAGVNLVTEFRPTIVFLDLGMPDVNGYETARRIRAEPEGRQTCLVALTGWGQDADKRRTCEAGFDRHLVKPADIDAIEEILSSASDETPQA